MNSTPVIDMFSGTGELARADGDGLNEFTGFQSFSDNYGPARKYLKARFRNVEIPEGSIVAIGAPCQDLSVAGRHAGAERGSGTRSSFIHGALDMAVTGGADPIVASASCSSADSLLSITRKEPLMPTKQARNCRVGDILLFKNKESRLITSIEYNPHKGEAYLIHTTDLAGENPRHLTYAALDRVIYWGTQEALF